MNNREAYLGTIQRDATVAANADGQLPVPSEYKQLSTLKIIFRIMLTLYTCFLKSKVFLTEKTRMPSTTYGKFSIT